MLHQRPPLLLSLLLELLLQPISYSLQHRFILLPQFLLPLKDSFVQSIRNLIAFIGINNFELLFWRIFSLFCIQLGLLKSFLVVFCVDVQPHTAHHIHQNKQ